MAVFGGLFLIGLLSVPVTTTTSALRQEPGSRLVFRTTYPKNSRMFLPAYLAAKSHKFGPGGLRVRSAEWAGTMAVIAILGIFDYLVLCRFLRRPPPRNEGRGPGPAGGDPDPPASGLSLFP